MGEQPSKELLYLEECGWKFERDENGLQHWYLPTAFMPRVSYDDAIKLNKTIQNWGSK